MFKAVQKHLAFTLRSSSNSSCRRTLQPILSTSRSMSSHNDPLNRPSPPPLPRADQREFEELVRKAQTPAISLSKTDIEAELALHPDARKPLVAEFEGDTNPSTGEQGGPKREPVRQWTEDGGDWSFKGRVSDF